MSKPMTVYLAELSHTGAGRSPNVVPLAAGFIASMIKKHFPGTAISIFRDPNEYLNATKQNPPDIAGFSAHVWSERLSQYCAQRTKDISPKTLIVAGGPSIDDIDSELLSMLRKYRQYDVLIPGEGENSFVRLLEHVRDNNGLAPDALIEGCARLSSTGTLIKGLYKRPEIADIPSPYLDGFLDRFLSEDYEPIIQSMRGCPYSCTFCVSGAPAWSRIRAFPLERVFAEFEYIKARTKSPYLILTDENLGILMKRDVEMAEYIMKSHKESGYPARLYFYTAKIVTEDVLKVVELMSPIGEFGMSLQTMDDEVRSTIKRTNIKFIQFLEYVKWAKARNIITSTELIFGFPGDTAENYIEGFEKLLPSGVDRIYGYNLRLFSGIDLATEENRAKYGYQTRFRMPERTFGRYDGKVVSETEEIVVGCNSFTMDDYMQVRRHGLFLELGSGRGYFSEFIQLLIRMGLPGERLIRFLSQVSLAECPKLKEIVSAYNERIEQELFTSPEALEKHMETLMAEDKPVPEVKLNFIFTGKIMLDAEVREELFGLLKRFVAEHDKDKDRVQILQDYVDNVLSKRVVSFSATEPEIRHGRTRIRIQDIWSENAGVDTLFSPQPFQLDFPLPKDAADFIARQPLVDRKDEAQLQDIYMTVSRFGLLRPYTVSPAE